MVKRSGKERRTSKAVPQSSFPSEVLHNKPQLFKEAMRSDDSCWHEAMKVEMNSNRGNGTGIVRSTKKALKLKWKFKRRTKADGSIERYTIGHGVDYGETYSPLVRYATVRLMVVSVRLGLKIHQLNAVTASRQIVEQLEVFGGRSKQVSYGTRSSKRYLLRDIGLQQSKWREGSHRGRICGRPSAVSAVPGAEP